MSVTGVALSLIALVVTCRGREVAAGERGEEGGGEGEEQGRCDTESDCASLGPGPSSLPEEWTCEAAPLPTPHATVVAAPPTRIVRRPRLTCPSGTTAGRVRSRGSRTTRTAWTRVAAPRRRPHRSRSSACSRFGGGDRSATLFDAAASREVAATSPSYIHSDAASSWMTSRREQMVICSRDRH